MWAAAIWAAPQLISVDFDKTYCLDLSIENTNIHYCLLRSGRVVASLRKPTADAVSHGRLDEMQTRPASLPTSIPLYQDIAGIPFTHACPTCLYNR